MEAGTAGAPRGFDHLREHSIGLPQVLFQSITHMAPAAAVAYSIFISVPQAQQALPLSVGLALIACICAATAIGQLAKLFPSAGGMYTYTAKALGPWAGFLVAWLFILFQPLVAPFLYLEFGWAMSDVFSNSIGWHYSGQWWIWVVLMTVVVFLLTYRDIRLSTTAGVILGAFEIAIFAALVLWMLLSNAGDLNLQPFNPHHAVGDWSGVFKGMVFAILAFIGFEASAPLGEEARNPRRTVPGRWSARRSRSASSTCSAPTHGFSAQASTTSSSRRRRTLTRGATSARSSGAAAGCSSSSRSATRSRRTPTRR
ncbi:MAG: hypothetical protein QOK34_385 [Gaiellaceae bacterium]|nr:hypothetical protein [Gaiellaceae bacterium]